MHNWPQQLQALRESDTHAVLVTVAGIRGSAPREIGSNMIVTEADVTGTIGGGYLENECIRLACAALREGDTLPARKLRRFALGSQCGQCCGGVVDVLFERVALDDAAWIDALVALQQAGRKGVLVTDLQAGDDTGKWLVTEATDGANVRTAVQNAMHPAPRNAPRAAHSGSKADEQFGNAADTVAEMLDGNIHAAALALIDKQQASTNIETRLTDGRKAKYLLERVGPAPLSIVLFGAGHVGRACAAVFGTLDAEVLVADSRADYLEHDWPANATAVYADTPALLVEHCPPRSYYLVMTHDHAIDLTLCEAILARNDRAFCGLIGSRSKQRRFEKQLRAAGIDETTLATLTCPIGIDSIGGKQPGEIAIATAAQVVAHHQQRLASTTDRSLNDAMATVPSHIIDQGDEVNTDKSIATTQSRTGTNNQQRRETTPKPQAR